MPPLPRPSPAARPARATAGSSARGLVASNAITLVAALVFGWAPAWLMWTYWVQSVIVGVYARRRMLELAGFSTEGFTSNDEPVPETEQGKRDTAGFFTLHYGAFHLGYLAFLLAEHRVAGAWNALVLVACGVSFVLSQRATYAVQHAADLRGRPNLGRMMFTPYLRVVPMHAGILMAGTLGDGAAMLVAFTALKTVADVALDAIDRRYATQTAAAPTPPA